MRMKWNKTASTDGTLTVQDMGTRGNSIPSILVKGKWVAKKAGIFPKDKVSIEVSSGQIIIRLVEKADPNKVLEWQRRDWVEPGQTPSVGERIKIPKV